MFYLIPSGKPSNYDNNYLVGYDLIRKVDSILDGNLDSIYYKEHLNFQSTEVVNNKFSTIYID